MSNHKEFKGANGSFQIGRSTDGDFWLNVMNKEFYSAMYAARVRMPFIGGGGMFEKTHTNICQIFTGEFKSSVPRKELKPIVICSDDFENSGEFTYIELAYLEKKFIAQAVYTGLQIAKSGYVEFDEPETIKALHLIYKGFESDQKRMLGFCSGEGGWFSEILSQDCFEKRNADRYQIFQTGLFMLKAGVNLPPKIEQRWQDEFKADQEYVDFVASRQRG